MWTVNRIFLWFGRYLVCTYLSQNALKPWWSNFQFTHAVFRQIWFTFQEATCFISASPFSMFWITGAVDMSVYDWVVCHLYMYLIMPNMLFLYPLLQRSWKGVILVSPCPSVDRIVSALYLQQYSSDPFHVCTSYEATSEGNVCFKIQKFEILANSLNM